MLLKTLTPRYFRYSWKSRTLGTEGQAFLSCDWLSWFLFPASTKQLNKLWSVVSPKPLHFLFPDHPGYFQVKNGQVYRSQFSFLVVIFQERKWSFFIFFWPSELEPWFPPPFVFSTQNFWNRGRKNTSSNKYTDNILYFFK